MRPALGNDTRHGASSAQARQRKGVFHQHTRAGLQHLCRIGAEMFVEPGAPMRGETIARLKRTFMPPPRAPTHQTKVPHMLAREPFHAGDRKSVMSGKGGAVRV